MQRSYPPAPLVGVAGVVLHGGQVLLIQRGTEPAKGSWSLPGGLLHLGEGLGAGCAREVQEETGLRVSVGPLVQVVERISRDDRERVQYHYVILDFLCGCAYYEPRAGDDAMAAAWVDLAKLPEYEVNEDTIQVILKAVAMQKSGGQSTSSAPD